MDIQIALDFFDLEEAISLAEEVTEVGVDLLEIGTPLIAGEGLRSVKVIRDKFPGKKVLVDFKTMDGGGLFVEKAAEFGADVATVMAVAEDETIVAAVEASKGLDLELEVDLLGVPDQSIVERAKEVEQLGADIITVHTAIDKIWKDPSLNPIKFVKPVANAVSVPVSVACVNAEYCLEAADAGAQVAVVGPGDLERPELLNFIRTVKEDER